MKKTISIFFIIFIFLFYLKISSYAQHACNQSCTGAANISCNSSTGQITYNRGSCNSGLACYSGAGNICRNPNCPTDTDCTCPTYRVQGYKTEMPGNNTNTEPFRSQAVYLDGGSVNTDQPYSFTNLSAQSRLVSVNNLSGSSIGYTLCYNNTDCHTNPPTAGNSIYVCPNLAINNSTDYADLWWHYTPLIPNAKDINGQTTVFVNDTVSYSATYEDYNTSLSNPLMYAYQSSCLGTPLTKISSGNSPGTHTFTWTPSSVGNFVVYAAAASTQATCIGYNTCVGSPPQYPCPGPNTSLSVSVVNPAPWYKLKNASLNKISDHNISVVQNVNKFVDGDPDDTTERYVIIGDAGILLATNSYNPGPVYNPIEASSINQYQGNYGSFNRAFLLSYYQYVTSRKLVREISDISQINTDGLFLIKTNSLTLTSNPPSYNFVLLIRKLDNSDYGDLTINVNNFGNTGKSYAFLAKNIIINSGTQIVNGIFISTNSFSYQNSEGLKINGNLLSSNPIVLNNRSDNSRPSLFINYNAKMYLDLLPFLSISKYDWQQSQ